MESRHTPPPEQLAPPSTVENREDTVLMDTYSDAYATGIVLFELLTNSRHAELIQRNLHGQSIYNYITSEKHEQDLEELLRNVDPGLAKIVLKATDPNPRYRYQTAADMKQALAPYLK